MEIIVRPIGFVRNSRKTVEDDHWGGIVSEIVIEIGEEALQGIEDFSHAEVIFYFDKVDESRIVSGARHPRNNPNWPKVGILAQRGKNRPNRLGLGRYPFYVGKEACSSSRDWTRWMARPSSTPNP